MSVPETPIMSLLYTCGTESMLVYPSGRVMSLDIEGSGYDQPRVAVDVRQVRR